MEIFQKLTTKAFWQRIYNVNIQLFGLAVLTGVISSLFTEANSPLPYIFAGIVFVGGFSIAAILGKINKPTAKEISRYLDRNYPFVEESASLLLNDPHEKTLQFHQKRKITEQLQRNASAIKLPVLKIKKASGIASTMFVLSFVILFAKPALVKMIDSFQSQPQINLRENNPEIADVPAIPEIQNVQITVQPPSYTKKEQQTVGFENISVIEKTHIRWEVETGGATEKVSLAFSNGEQIAFGKKDDQDLFYFSSDVSENKIYQLVISNSDTTVYSSFRSIEVIADLPPGFVIKKPTENRSFINPQNKQFKIEAEIGDDFGVTETAIQATLARGSGENVRFREQRISFDSVSGLGSTKVQATKIIDADELEMKPGDELYFYITAADNNPETLRSRSETYFIIYSDTAEINTFEIAGLGIDLLPEYFRSQRQIIIDTEALLADQPGISTQEFNERSESIGYDQNLLRKRYGDYLGQDDEGGFSNDPEHTHEEEVENLNEMGLEREESDAAAIIPDEFFHDHGAAEMNTLFAESPRALLKQALDNMWNAEVNLRTRQPEDALPYEYKALELLKEVQQANRAYSRKAGYELPPIPEQEKRLTGEFDDFAHPKTEIKREKKTEALVQLYLLIKSEGWPDIGLINEAKTLIQQAQISDSDLLFLLNNIRRLENDGGNAEIDQQILERINQINERLQMDPTPQTRPSITFSAEH